MRGDGDLRRGFWTALVAILLGLAFRLHVIALPTDLLTARYLSDDYFCWTRTFPEWATWERIYESPPLDDGTTLVFLRLPSQRQ
jgi:hypothetical protein